MPMRRPTPLAALAAAALVYGTALLAGTPPAYAAAPNSATRPPAVQIKAAWIRWLPGGVPLAGYATLANVSDQPLVLTSATSPAFHDVSLHQTVHVGGMVRMSPLDRLSIAPHATLDFESRGIHLMLMQPSETLDPESAVPITLHFADGSSLTVPFQIRTATRG